ncbi:LIM and calponin homology domains-containing protein 1-like isoform X3 [Phyllopteryx taeniolatus]|uniref:LIM and calponin homology domains-containing protein 1-like isoform X3 n=1 Tax=Phyllopteryx taeniolatus TaxID=161469 RepID=UPI002AD3D947|nr:LIM and calponin homology domains-containing protein 1-like isoform X3 [Phyllopteryx taeniolatus]
MASPPAGRGRHVRSRPEPACLEAQKWIEAVTGKSFGDKDFRSALENGILLCELLSAIRPGLVKKINRLPAPIAGLDNLSVFLRACEELGLNGSQLFDPGDLQDTSIRANLKDSDCSRKLKNVLNTVFWLGKAASGCASYSGPALDLKEFEGLLANMKADGEEAADGSQKRRVRDSGYDCWDSERSDSLSPPGHTRDNSLDSLDSVGSRSQHSPSPDVANQGTTEGRDGDLVAHGSGRLDAQKDDMSARRAASGEARTPVVFNQFLPSRSNAGSYVLNTRRRPHAEDREQRSLAEGKKTPKSVTWAPDHQGERDICEQTRLQRLEKAGIKVVPAALRYGSPSSSSTSPTPERPASPNIILRRDNDFFNSHKSAWDSSSDGEGEAEGQKVPDVRKDDLASRRAPRGPAVPRMHHFVVATPLLECSSKDQERWEGIRRASHKTLKDKDTSQLDQIPDIITRQREGKDEEEDCEEQSEDAGTVKATPDKRTDDLALRRARSRPSPLLRDGPMSLSSAAMSQADVQKWERLRMSEPSEPGPVPVCQACREKTYGSGERGLSKSVRFGGVTEMGQPMGVPESGLLGRLVSQATVAVPTIGLGSLLSEREGSLADGALPEQATSNGSRGSLEAPRSLAEPDARPARCESGLKEEEEEEGRIPDIRKDDMTARRTGAFQKQSVSSGSYNRFLPLPASKYKVQVTLPSTEEVDRNKNIRAAEGKDLIESNPRTHIESEHVDDDGDDVDDEVDEPLPNPEKDDMMARRTGCLQKSSATFRQFLPVPGVLKNKTIQSCGNKQAPKCVEKMASESSGVRSARKREGPEGEADVQKDKTADVTNVTPSLLRPDDVVPPSREAGLGKASKKMEKPQRKKASCVADDDLPPVMMNRRVAFMCGDAESASMSDMADRDEAGHSPPLSLSRYERMHEQYNNFQDEDDRWQSDLARWKNRRRCASQELIKKEEERKRMERMNGEGGDKRKSIKTYKEIVEEKERREAELCEAYRDAASPDEAAGVLQRYALRFTISDATLDFLKLPRSSANPDATLNQAIRKHRTVHDDSEPESTQQKTCEDFHVGLKKGPLASDSTPPRSQETLDSPTQTSSSKPEPATKVDAKPQPAPPRSAKPALTLPAPPPPPAHSRPVPLLAAKPYCPPRSSHGIKMDGLVRANGDTDNSPLHSPSDKDNLVAQAETEASSLPEIRDRSPPPQAATSSSSSSSSVSSSSSSAISSLFGGRSCITKTTIVTELTQTLVEPHGLENNSHSRVNGSTSVEKAAEEQQSQPASSSTSITSIQEHCASVTERQEESSMSEQYKKEQEKLKKEWEKAQVEVQEEERKHNEEERKILEETVAPLKPRVGSASPPPGDKETVSHLVPLQQNGHKDTRGSEEQHASKLHFFRDAVSDTEPAPKSESWKTASLGRNTQPNRPRGVKRCDSHDAISGTQRPSSPLPPSPSRCISRKRQCSGCSQPLGKGAAMIIQTLGLFFHMQCFKCGLCEGQLGDATTGTDVRIRNGLLSCHHCYVASTSRGQPTTL